MSTPTSLVYKSRRLPVRLLEEDWEATTTSKVKQEMLRQKIFKAPETGTLLVSGTAGPIINQLYQMGRKCAGLSLIEYFESKLQSEGEKPPVSEVIFLYGVGNEPAKSGEYGGKLISGLMEYCKNRGYLLVIETHLSPTNFEVRYGINITTKISIKLKAEDAWL